MSQLGLFEPVDPRPKRRAVSNGNSKPKYTRYHHERAKTPHKCDFCILNQVEDRTAPVARLARYKRSAEGRTIYLCGPHTNDQRIIDGLSEVKMKPSP